jgi:hypothetical protein
MAAAPFCGERTIQHQFGYILAVVLEIAREIFTHAVRHPAVE